MSKIIFKAILDYFAFIHMHSIIFSLLRLFLTIFSIFLKNVPIQPNMGQNLTPIKLTKFFLKLFVRNKNVKHFYETIKCFSSAKNYLIYEPIKLFWEPFLIFLKPILEPILPIFYNSNNEKKINPLFRHQIFVELVLYCISGAQAWGANGA